VSIACVWLAWFPGSSGLGTRLVHGLILPVKDFTACGICEGCTRRGGGLVTQAHRSAELQSWPAGSVVLVYE